MSDATQLHAEQVEYWNGAGGERWIAQQARRDAMLGQFAEIALERASIQPGETVIDVGCGCGETSVELARLVGPAGKVLAADVSAPILACAKERLEAFPNASAVQADAATYDFAPGAADLIFSRFGVMFFGDPVAAFANLRRALKPQGRVTFACWRTPVENAWMTAPLQATYLHVPRPPPPDPELPGPFAFADKDRVSRILVAAGFAQPTFEPIDATMDMAVGEGVDGAVGTALQLGPTSRLVADQPQPVKDAVAASLRDFFQSRLVDGRLEFAAAIWVVQTCVRSAQ